MAKAKYEFMTSTAADAARAFIDATEGDDGASDAIGRMQKAGAKALEDLEADVARVSELMEGLFEADAADGWVPDEDEVHEQIWSVDVDIPALAREDRGLLQVLIDIVSFVESSEYMESTACRLGRTTVEPDELIEAAREAAGTHARPVNGRGRAPRQTRQRTRNRTEPKGAWGEGYFTDPGQRDTAPDNGAREFTLEEQAFLRDAGLQWPIPELDLRRAYRGLARLHHPDVHGGNVVADHRMGVINRGYELLLARVKGQ